MRTPIDDDDLGIPEIDLSTVQWLPNPFAKQPGEKTEIVIDGAVAYQLRLIPSNKVLARFGTTLAAWPVIIAAIDGGRSPRTLAFDAVMSDGRVERVSAGSRLERFARHSNGEPDPYANASALPPGRRASGAA